MKITTKLALIGATSLFAFDASVANAQTLKARNLYSFGDQSSSVGNDGWLWDPSRGYSGPSSTFRYANTRGWEWRFSNGTTWVERLGYQQGLAPALNKIQDPWGGFTGQYRGYNFAHANAAFARDSENNPNVASSIYSFEAQVDYYASLVRSGRIKTASNDLITYWDNGNNFEYVPGGFNDAAFISATKKIFTNLRSVANARATIVTIGSIAPTAYAERYTITPGYAPTIDLNHQYINFALRLYAEVQGNQVGKARVIYVDPNYLIGDIRENPARYGFKYTTPTQISRIQTCASPAGPCDIEIINKVHSTLQSGYNGTAWDDPYLFYSTNDTTATLTWRGHQILADYVASNLAGVYAWDQFRAVGSGSGAKALTALGVVAGAPAFAQTAFGFASTTNAKGAQVFALGFNDSVGDLSALQSRGGNLKLLGTSAQVTPNLRIGASSFYDQGNYDSLGANVRGRGGAGFATLDLGNHIDLNILAASQNRTINTARPITFQYVGGVARAKTRVNLDVAQASLSRMFDVKGVKVGPVASVANVRERWGETRETGVPQWLAVNRQAGGFSSTAYNLGMAADYSFMDKRGGTWNLSAKAGQIKTDDWTSVALVAPTQTLADALEAEKGSANFVTLGVGRQIDRGWSLGLEAGYAKTLERDVGALRARAVLTF